MLKIKDSVDLKELEKFGFTKYGEPIMNDYFKIFKGYFLVIGLPILELGVKSEISKYNGQLESKFDLFNGFQKIELKEEDIKDLIQAGLVERVEE